MGRLQAEEFAYAVDTREVSLDTALEWHFVSNHFPPLPTELIESAKEAIRNADAGDWDAEINLLGYASYKGEKAAPTWACVEAWHLDSFLRGEETPPSPRNPRWLRYGGEAWAPDLGMYVSVPERVWPIVDIVADELGAGIIVALGGLDVVVDELEEAEIG